jgi:hypothetical protein
MGPWAHGSKGQGLFLGGAPNGKSNIATSCSFANLTNAIDFIWIFLIQIEGFQGNRQHLKDSVGLGGNREAKTIFCYRCFCCCRKAVATTAQRRAQNRPNNELRPDFTTQPLQADPGPCNAKTKLKLSIVEIIGQIKRSIKRSHYNESLSRQQLSNKANKHRASHGIKSPCSATPRNTHSLPAPKHDKASDGVVATFGGAVTPTSVPAWGGIGVARDEGGSGRAAAAMPANTGGLGSGLAMAATGVAREVCIAFSHATHSSGLGM